MIVGFDNDDPSIFEEQFQFLQAGPDPDLDDGHAQRGAEDAAARRD